MPRMSYALKMLISIILCVEYFTINVGFPWAETDPPRTFRLPHDRPGNNDLDYYLEFRQFSQMTRRFDVPRRSASGNCRHLGGECTSRHHRRNRKSPFSRHFPCHFPVLPFVRVRFRPHIPYAVFRIVSNSAATCTGCQWGGANTLENRAVLPGAPDDACKS